MTGVTCQDAMGEPYGSRDPYWYLQFHTTDFAEWHNQLPKKWNHEREKRPWKQTCNAHLCRFRFSTSLITSGMHRRVKDSGKWRECMHSITDSKIWVCITLATPTFQEYCLRDLSNRCASRLTTTALHSDTTGFCYQRHRRDSVIDASAW